MNALNSQPEKEPNGLKDKVQIPAEYVNEKCSLPRENINETDCVNSGDPPVIMRCNLTKIWSNERIKSKRKSCSGNNHDKVGIESKNDANTTKITKGYCEQQENSEISSSRRFALTKYKQHELRSDTKPCEAPSESSEYYKTWEKKFKRKLGNIDAKTKSNKFDLSFAVKKKRINNKIQTREFVRKECEYFCDACGRMYNSFECLKCHIRAVHFRKNQIICEICDQTFMWKSDLKLHEDTEHPEFSDKRFSCSLCRKRFHTRQQLDMHIRSHNGEFKCSICNINLCSQESLVQHTRRKHTGEMPFSCFLCNKSWASKHELKFHTRKVHLEEAKFSCEKCDKMFFSKKNFIGHVASHDNNLCSNCGKKFNGYYAYETHLPTCERKSVQSSSSDPCLSNKLDLLRRK